MGTIRDPIGQFLMQRCSFFLKKANPNRVILGTSAERELSGAINIAPEVIHHVGFNLLYINYKSNTRNTITDIEIPTI
jgi:hypothetical protein